MVTRPGPCLCQIVMHVRNGVLLGAPLHGTLRVHVSLALQGRGTLRGLPQQRQSQPALPSATYPLNLGGLGAWC